MDRNQCQQLAHQQWYWLCRRIDPWLRHTSATNGFSYGYAITGSMGLTILGPNTLTLSQSNTYSGPTNILGGTLALSNSGALQRSTLIAPTVGVVSFAGTSFTLGGLSGSGNLSLYNTATATGVALTVGGNNASTTYGGALSDYSWAAGTLTKIGTGTLTLLGANTYSGSTTITGGTLQLGDGTSGHDGSISSTAGIIDNTALVFNLFGPETSSGIGGSGNLVKAGSGCLTLSGTNGYGGTTTISGGTLAPTAPRALPGYAASKLSVNGATLALSVGTGTSTWAASNVNSLVTANSNNFTSSSVLELDTTNSATNGFSYASAISGSMGLTTLGTHPLILSGNNSYTGNSIVNSGTLEVTKPGALPGYGISSRLTVGPNGTLTLDGTGWTTATVGSLVAANSGGFFSGSTLGIDTTGVSGSFVSGPIAGNMGLTKLGSQTLTLTGASTFFGSTTINAGTLQLGDGNNGHDGSLTAVGGIIDNAALVYNLFGSQTYCGAISGSGSLSKQGGGTLILLA